MITSSLLVILIGSFFLYNTSEKVMLHRGWIIEKWVQANQKISKFIGIACFIVALITTITILGRTSGFLFWLVSLMTILGLVTLITPLQKLSYKHISILFTILFILELTF